MRNIAYRYTTDRYDVFAKYVDTQHGAMVSRERGVVERALRELDAFGVAVRQ